MRIGGLFVAGVLVLLSVPADAQPLWSAASPAADASPSGDSGAAARHALRTAFGQLRERDFAAAELGFAALIESDGFDALEEDQQYETLSIAGRLSLELKKPAHAHPLLVRASGYGQADGGIWHTRLLAAAELDDDADVARCIVMIARRWPPVMRELDGRTVVRLAKRLAQQASAASEHRELLDALFDTGFSVDGESPDDLWLSLVRLALEQDHVARARYVARKIGAPESLLAMHVDRRFDRVVEASERFALSAAIEADLQRARERAQAAPDRLYHRTMLQRRLLDEGRYADALADTDAVIARVTDGGGSTHYVDFDDQYPWVLDQRATALQGLKRWDEAIAQLHRAARRPEEGFMNVSQVLNLAWLYAELGKDDEALEAVQDIGEPSPYGRMQIEMLYLMVAVQRKDALAVERHLAFMQAHRGDAIATYQRALLHAGRVDAAAVLLIERLDNPDWRSAALIEVQPYAAVRSPPILARRDKRRRAMLARSDVQAAIAEVGYLRPPARSTAPTH